MVLGVLLILSLPATRPGHNLLVCGSSPNIYSLTGLVHLIFLPTAGVCPPVGQKYLTFPCTCVCLAFLHLWTLSSGSFCQITISPFHISLLQVFVPVSSSLSQALPDLTPPQALTIFPIFSFHGQRLGKFFAYPCNTRCSFLLFFSPVSYPSIGLTTLMTAMVRICILIDMSHKRQNPLTDIGLAAGLSLVLEQASVNILLNFR